MVKNKEVRLGQELAERITSKPLFYPAQDGRHINQKWRQILQIKADANCYRGKYFSHLFSNRLSCRYIVGSKLNSAPPELDKTLIETKTKAYKMALVRSNTNKMTKKHSPIAEQNQINHEQGSRLENKFCTVIVEN